MREVARYIGTKAQIAIISRTRPISPRIYLDHAATTPLRPEAKAAMEEGFRLWANPSSPHAEGRKARALLEDARERIKLALGWDGELIFTSGASEALAIALGQTIASRCIVSAVEHDAVLLAAPHADIIPIDRNAVLAGEVDCARLRQLVDGAGSALVAVQHINSETGFNNFVTRRPPLVDVVRSAGGLLLVDCAQSAGKFPLPEAADIASISAHKFGGPIGIGALLVRDFSMLRPSGGHERGYRRGTENLPGAIGMAAALEACCDPYVDIEVLDPLDAFRNDIRALAGVCVSSQFASATPYIHAIAMPGLSAKAQVMRFDMAGISVSQGSACSSGTMKPSRVLEAMGVNRDIAERTIRVSLGWNNTRAEVKQFCDVWLEMARAHA